MIKTPIMKAACNNASGFLCAKECEKIKEYTVIYADPSWRYAQKGLQGAAGRHYPTMRIEELCALPVAAPDSVFL